MPVGTWTQIVYSGCIPTDRKNSILARIRKGLADEKGMTEQHLSHFNVRYDGEAHEEAHERKEHRDALRAVAFRRVEQVEAHRQVGEERAGEGKHAADSGPRLSGEDHRRRPWRPA